MKVAIVHDWLVNLSGAERVLIELHKIFPEAPIYTLFENRKFTNQYLPNAEIRSSFLQKIPGITKNYKYFFFLMPTAIESFDLSNFDLVISSSAIFSKGLVLKPKTKHICYCYSPTRQIWDLHSGSNPTSLSFRLAQHLFRLWDRQASDRVDEFVAISEHVRERIKKYYRRDARVIYPPCNINSTRLPDGQEFQIPNSDYYLIVSRLYKHKNIDIAIEAFNKLNLPLVIIGDGPEKERLKSKIEKGKNIKLLGFISDEELPYYYQNCRVFIMPQEEDFGITPIEAMSFGKPVLALRKGGAVETIIEGKTGEFFNDPIPEALADGVRRLNENYQNYDPDFIKKHTEKFSVTKFRGEILKLVYNN
ncbi:MAG: glycosyltransferase [bacterium]|nr:glycosyltransferase [bacterium]